MAHRVVVGTGTDNGRRRKTSTATSSFVIESQYVRLTARNCCKELMFPFLKLHYLLPLHIRMITYIPAGLHRKLFRLQRYSCPVVGVTTSDTATIIDCPEGMQVPFSVGNYVSFRGWYQLQCLTLILIMQE